MNHSSEAVNGTKEGGPLDWYVEGPGRRVGYDDLTAIDWIFEYTKERQRLKILYSTATGFVGYLRQLLDASQIWVVLVLTGIAVGLLAAGIDVAGDWLGDLKTGYCSNGPGGGKFYLNKGFCCWGHEGRIDHDKGPSNNADKNIEWAQCQDWKPWRVALGLGKGGGYVVEYIFFVLFSVRFV